MEKIAHKLKQQFYDNIDEIAAEFTLMFENGKIENAYNMKSVETFI